MPPFSASRPPPWASWTLLLILYIGCASVVAQTLEGTRIVVLWTYPTPIDDFGYSYSIDHSRLQAEEDLFAQGVDVHSTFIANLSVPDCGSIITDALLTGLDGLEFDMWMAGGQQFEACVQGIKTDKRFDRLKIVHLSGAIRTSDIALTSPAAEEARFLHGMVCAQATKTGTVGYIGSVKTNSQVSKALNAFVLGVKYLRPDVRVVVGLTGSFLDVVAETKATEILIKEASADCIAQQQNDLTVHAVATSYGVYSIGYATDARYYAGELVLTSAKFNWEPLILPFIQNFLLGKWNSSLDPPAGLSSGAISLTPYSTLFNLSWRKDIDELIPKIEDGSFLIFCTPLFNDPTYFTPGNTFKPNANTTCLTRQAIENMMGVTRIADVLVEYNATNSPYTVVYVHYSDAGSVVLYILTAILAIASAVTMFDVYRNRSSPAYRHASPLFCFLTLAGILIGCIAPLMWPGPKTKHNCMATWWTIGVGYGIAISCILAKNWRIWRIFSSERLRVVAIMNTQLLARWVVVIVLGEIFMLSMWTAFDPNAPKMITNPRTGFGQIQLLCASKSGKTYGMGAFLGYNVVLLILAAFMSYWTRNVKEEYKESAGLAIAVYISLVIILVFIALTIASPNDYVVRFYLSAYGTWGVLTVTYVALFLPKFWRTHFIGTSNTPSSTMQLSTFNSQPAFDSGTRPSVMTASYAPNPDRHAPVAEVGEDAYDHEVLREL